jgi:hypothetical protein
MDDNGERRKSYTIFESKIFRRTHGSKLENMNEKLGRMENWKR